jgi:hypothetical protein
VTCGVVGVELRGFEPLTPCMPSRDPRHDANHEPLRYRAKQQNKDVGLVVARAGSSGWVAAHLLPQRHPWRAAVKRESEASICGNLAGVQLYKANLAGAQLDGETSSAPGSTGRTWPAPAHPDRP